MDVQNMCFLQFWEGYRWVFVPVLAENEKRSCYQKNKNDKW